MSEVEERMRRRFVWRAGVLGWGVSVGVLWATVFWWQMSFAAPFGVILALALAIFPASGYVWGSLMWRWTHPKRRADERAG